MISNAGYDAVIVVHVLCAVVGFGALGATGAYANLARRASAPFAHPSLRQYFQSRRNLAEWAIFAVPVLGGLLLVLQHGQDASRAYPWVGLGLWVAATGIASSAIWPTERAVQRLYAEHDGSFEVDEETSEELERACRRMARAGAIVTICFVLALLDMVIQPF